MKPSLHTLALFTIVSLSLLSAEGCIAAGDDELAPLDAPLSSVESAINCYGATASSITTNITVSSNVMTATGTCSFSGGDVNGAHLDYFLDGSSSPAGSGDYPCSPGQVWQFTNASPVSCGSHTFKVVARPIKLNSPGVENCDPKKTTQQSTSFSNPIASNQCCILGSGGTRTTYPAGSHQPGNQCNYCDPTQAQDTWSQTCANNCAC